MQACREYALSRTHVIGSYKAFSVDRECVEETNRIMGDLRWQERRKMFKN